MCSGPERGAIAQLPQHPLAASDTSTYNRERSTAAYAVLAVLADWLAALPLAGRSRPPACRLPRLPLQGVHHRPPGAAVCAVAALHAALRVPHSSGHFQPLVPDVRLPAVRRLHTQGAQRLHTCSAQASSGSRGRYALCCTPQGFACTTACTVDLHVTACR